MPEVISFVVASLADLDASGDAWLTLSAGPYWGSRDGRIEQRLVQPGEQLRFAGKKPVSEGGPSWCCFVAEDGIELNIATENVAAFIERGQFEQHRVPEAAPLKPRVRLSALAAHG